MWTIFKVLTEFVTILLLLYVLVFWPPGTWDLSSLTGDQTRSPCIGRQSLNHWTTREVRSRAFLLAAHLSIPLISYLGSLVSLLLGLPFSLVHRARLGPHSSFSTSNPHCREATEPLCHSCHICKMDVVIVPPLSITMRMKEKIVTLYELLSPMSL